MTLFRGSPYYNFFVQWGQLEQQEMVFHQMDRTISLLVRWKSQDSLAQAALSLFGGRFLVHGSGGGDGGRAGGTSPGAADKGPLPGGSAASGATGGSHSAVLRKGDMCCPINLEFCNYEKRKNAFLAQQTSFAELTRGRGRFGRGECRKNCCWDECSLVTGRDHSESFVVVYF